MLNRAAYLLACIKEPKLKDFFSMGLGIEARYRRCRSFWDKHLECCKEFQRRAFADLSKDGAVAVLGAGSLLDLDIKLLEERFVELWLFDANTMLKRSWSRKLRNSPLKIKHNFADLSGSIESWSAGLKGFLKTKRPEEDIALYLSGLKPFKPEVFSDIPRALISLNILSQIPIYWRDRVHALLKKYARISTNENGEYAPALQRALNKNMQDLQRQHLEILFESGAELIVLISDIELFYYTNDRARWLSARAVYLDELTVKGFQQESSDSWYWHIAPQGIEEKDYGSIHNVWAGSFRSLNQRAQAN